MTMSNNEAAIFDSFFNAAKQDADKRIVLIEQLSVAPFPELLTTFAQFINDCGVDWTASVQPPKTAKAMEESWPDELCEYFAHCDGVIVDDVVVDEEGTLGLPSADDVYSANNRNPKISQLIKKNNYEGKTRIMRPGALPIWEYGGSDALDKCNNGEYQYRISLKDLDDQLIFKTDNDCEHVVYFLSSINGIPKGSVVEIAGAAEFGTRYESIRYFIAYQAYMVDLLYQADGVRFDRY